MKITLIDELIDKFKRLPGIGKSTATRLVYYLISTDEEYLQSFGDSILKIKSEIRHCEECFNLSQSEKCNICLNKEQRNMSKMCIVEHFRTILLFEKYNLFDGLYHNLRGLIEPIKGITPDKLTIDDLTNRIKSYDIKEVFFAVTPSIEGDATILYVKKQLENSDIKFTRLARGLPSGWDLEYVDEYTLINSVENREDI